MGIVNAELSQYDPALGKKPQIVAVNKTDLPEVQARLPELKEMFRLAGIEPFFISAALGYGTQALMDRTAGLLESSAGELRQAGPAAAVVFRPQPRQRATIRKEGETFVIESPELERIVARVDTNDAEVRRQLQRQIFRLGLKRALSLAGVKPGDKVRCGNYTWEW
jgi:GTP-binding protein